VPPSCLANSCSGWQDVTCKTKDDGDVLLNVPHYYNKHSATRKAKLLLFPYMDSADSWCREGTSEKLNLSAVDIIYDSLDFGVTWKPTLSHLDPRPTRQNLCAHYNLHGAMSNHTSHPSRQRAHRLKNEANGWVL
jgi:hypothetical protein